MKVHRAICTKVRKKPANNHCNADCRVQYPKSVLYKHSHSRTRVSSPFCKWGNWGVERLRNAWGWQPVVQKTWLEPELYHFVELPLSDFINGVKSENLPCTKAHVMGTQEVATGWLNDSDFSYNEGINNISHSWVLQ